ncbi:putative ABC transport system permease protein [Paenibacillus turicensis]|uniref:ABC transport system permease protein n=1 Tax=Paenibacillus turicensis TaxID=160487 RepID=A0ABS4FV92_9BACL|nr:FtsX-like permease family protein [Paenibacillus turicensis]MBP1906445.1 putative ABC transport system permease protein [Paenibacillus turicensis]
MGSFKFAIANIKKSKSAELSLFILIILASLLLTIGAGVLLTMNNFFPDKATSLHDAHVNILMDRKQYKEDYHKFISSYPGVDQAEKENVLLLTRSTIKLNDERLSIKAAILDLDHQRQIAPLRLIEGTISRNNDVIYLPYMFKLKYNYELDQIFEINYHNTSYRYHIAGFFDTALMGSGIFKFYLPHSGYGELQNQVGDELNGVLLSSILQDSQQASSLLTAYIQTFPESSEAVTPSFAAIDIQMAQNENSMTINAISIILIAFSAIVVLISLIIIQFRIKNSIHESLKNIAVLKAIGYTSKQIIFPIILQFVMIALVGGCIGVSLCYAIFPFVNSLITSLSGLLWQGNTPMSAALFSLLTILILVFLVVVISSIRIRKLKPVEGLRSGINSHNFKRNFFALEQARGGISFVMSCKNIMTNIRQIIMVVIITTAVTFASIFSFVMYDNIANDKTALLQMLGTETPNIGIIAAQEQDAEQLITVINGMNGVIKANIQDQRQAVINGMLITLSITDDFEKLEINTVIKGKQPKYDNEIVLSKGLAQRLGKDIGDQVKLTMGASTYTFLISGLNQINDGGYGSAAMTTQSIRYLIPNYRSSVINVYLQKEHKSQFIDQFKQLHSNKIVMISDVDQALDKAFQSYTSMMFSVMVVILIATLLVIMLILYILIKMTIVKQKHQFGLLKALGFTTMQLMTQVTLSFTPVIFVGTILGGILGYLYINPLLGLLFSNAGMSNVHFVIHPSNIILLCISITCLAYTVAMIITRKIKSISTYNLLTE